MQPSRGPLLAGRTTALQGRRGSEAVRGPGPDPASRPGFPKRSAGTGAVQQRSRLYGTPCRLSPQPWTSRSTASKSWSS